MAPHVLPRYVTAIIGVLFLIGQTAAQEGRIAIRMEEGTARFYHTATGERFTPRGFNYIQLVQSPAGPYGESRLFQPDSHDPAAIDDDFQRMSALGYNVVRVFVDLCRDERCIADEDGLIEAYIGNIANLLQRAQQYGLYVMLTANWLPDLGGYSQPAHTLCEQGGDFVGGNCLVMSAKGVELYGKFFTDLILALQQAGAPMETVWAYELRNEFFVEHNYLPFTKSSGMVTTANGESYNMASQADKVRMGEDAVVFWANSTREAIRAIDPDALVTAGFFTPNEPNVLRPGDQRVVPFVAALERSELDFFGIHAYAGFHPFQLEAENFAIIDYTEKPLVLGEYGTFLPSAADEYMAAQLADHWQADACSFGVEGFTFWTWDRHMVDVMNPDDPWAGSDEGAFIAQVLSPFNKMSSCDILLPMTNVAEGKPTAASMVWDGFPSSNVVDGNATGTPWIAGGDPPQWVEVDLLQTYDLAAIQIVVETGSDDPHFYTHDIQVKASEEDAYQTIHTFAGERVNFEVLTYPEDGDGFIPNVRFVRVFVPQAPGWAALHELRAIIPQERDEFDVPPPPVLTFPRPGMDTFAGTVVRWKNDVAGLASQVQFAMNSTFDDIIEAHTGVTADQLDIAHLAAYDTLYWRVKQKNAFGESFWSVTGAIAMPTSSIGSAADGGGVAVYPNPSKNTCTISGLTPGEQVRLVDACGVTVQTTRAKTETCTISVSAMPSGVYFLLVLSQRAVRYTAKVIVTR